MLKVFSAVFRPRFVLVRTSRSSHSPLLPPSLSPSLQFSHFECEFLLSLLFGSDWVSCFQGLISHVSSGNLSISIPSVAQPHTLTALLGHSDQAIIPSQSVISVHYLCFSVYFILLSLCPTALCSG